MDKRYQVFVSSTYQDLQEERQEVMHALLELDCIPSGMELFPAANESQWSLIQKVIEDCDYYILILGGRYGSISLSGKSYTEMEYEYAIELGKPTIAFLHKEPGKIIADRVEQTEDGKKALAQFRDSAQKKLCKYWSSPQELGSVVSRSLIQLIKSSPATGWIRSDAQVSPEASLEILKLKQENDELKAQLSAAKFSAPEGTENLAQGDDLVKIDFTFHGRDDNSIERYLWTIWEWDTAVSWNQLFGEIAPILIHEASDVQLNRAINSYIVGLEESAIFEHKPERITHYQDATVTPKDLHTIKIQLRALGLIAQSDRPRSVKDSGAYWTLTPYGDSVMTRLRALTKEQSG